MEQTRNVKEKVKNYHIIRNDSDCRSEGEIVVVVVVNRPAVKKYRTVAADN